MAKGARYKVFWTKEASLDLEEIINFIFEDSPKNAGKIFKEIQSQCAKLTKLPERSRVVPELKDIGILDYRELIVSKYRIFYKIAGERVYIFAVMDGRRDLEAFLFGRLIRS